MENRPSAKSKSLEKNLRVCLLKKILFKKHEEMLRIRTARDLLAMVNMFSAVSNPQASREVNSRTEGEIQPPPQQSRGQKRKYQDLLSSPSKYQRI